MLAAALENALGKTTMHEGDFIHCGPRHRQLKDVTAEVDQIEHMKNLKCIEESTIMGTNDETYLPRQWSRNNPRYLVLQLGVWWQIWVYVYMCRLFRDTWILESVMGSN